MVYFKKKKKNSSAVRSAKENFGQNSPLQAACDIIYDIQLGLPFLTYTWYFLMKAPMPLAALHSFETCLTTDHDAECVVGEQKGCRLPAINKNENKTPLISPPSCLSCPSYPSSFSSSPPPPSPRPLPPPRPPVQAPPRPPVQAPQP